MFGLSEQFVFYAITISDLQRPNIIGKRHISQINYNPYPGLGFPSWDKHYSTSTQPDGRTASDNYIFG